jgi:hypothetical protein
MALVLVTDVRNTTNSGTWLTFIPCFGVAGTVLGEHPAERRQLSVMHDL